MKITIYEPGEEREKELYLRLRSDDNCAVLEAVDPHCGLTISLILQIDNDGIFRYEGVNPRLGLDLDGKGRVKVVDP